LIIAPEKCVPLLFDNKYVPLYALYLYTTLVIMKYWISKQPLSLFGNGGEFTRNCPRRISVDIVIGVQVYPRYIITKP
jgi:hypothetical protein